MASLYRPCLCFLYFYQAFLLYLAQKGPSRLRSYALIVDQFLFLFIQQEIKSLKEACLLRGQELHFGRPDLQ